MNYEFSLDGLPVWNTDVIARLEVKPWMSKQRRHPDRIFPVGHSFALNTQTLKQMCQKLQEVLSKSDRLSTGVRQLVVSGAFVRCCRCAGTPEVDLNKNSAKLRLKKKIKITCLCLQSLLLWDYFIQNCIFQLLHTK